MDFTQNEEKATYRQVIKKRIHGKHVSRPSKTTYPNSLHYSHGSNCQPYPISIQIIVDPRQIVASLPYLEAEGDDKDVRKHSLPDLTFKLNKQQKAYIQA